MKAKERAFYDKYLKEHSQQAEDSTAKGVGIGGGSKGCRVTTAGCEGKECYSNICGKEGAVMFCHMNRQWYCSQCADIMNHYAGLAGLEPVCVPADGKCKKRTCGFFDKKCDLNCSGWGFSSMSPIECIRVQAAERKEYKAEWSKNQLKTE
jgi:hypothetical protein